MENWQKALDKFLENYIHQDWFEGALLCGSYASGNQNEFSDIDVTIIASNSLTWQEKSNCYVDGFLMEYTINPISRFEEYMEESLKEHDYTNQYLLLYGKILYDTHGEIQKLRISYGKKVDLKKLFHALLHNKNPKEQTSPIMSQAYQMQRD